MSNRTIIIGDIHACAFELFELLAAVEVDDRDTVVAAGDLFDRGPDPWSIYQYFSSSPRRLAVMGNHERKHVRKIYSRSQMITRLQLGDERYRIVREWMKTLPLWLDLPEALVVHNAYVPGIPMKAQDPSILVGHLGGEAILKRMFQDGKWWMGHTLSKPVVFGHHRQEKIELKKGQVFAVDGRCVKNGYLHALILPEQRIVSVKAKKNYWQETRSQYPELYVTIPSLRSSTWAALRRLMEKKTLTDGFRVQLQQWISVMETFADSIAEKAMAQSSAMIGHIPKEDRKSAWMGVNSHPAARLLIQAHQGSLTGKIVMAKLATPDKMLSVAFSLGLDVSGPEYEVPGKDLYEGLS